MTARLPAGPVHLRARWVLGHADGRHQLLPRRRGGVRPRPIVFVGRDFPGEVAERHDLGNAILTPGLIDLDALSDLDTTILAYDNHPAWKTGRVWPQSYMERGPYEMYSDGRARLPETLCVPGAAAQRHHHGTADRVTILSCLGRDFRRVRRCCRRGRGSGPAGLSGPGLSHRQSLCDASGRDRAVLRRAARTGRPRGRHPLLPNVRGPGRRADPHHAGA